MPTDSVTSKTIIGIECESLEGDSWGIARLTRKLLEQLAARPELERTHRFILYSHRALPNDALYQNPLFIQRPCGPGSFSLYYYLVLPLRLWWDRPAAMYYPNYMLPIIHPPLVPSLVTLTEDVWHEMRNPKRAWRYRLGYWIFCYWAARCASNIMAISQASKAALAALFRIPARRIITNALAVDRSRDTDTRAGRYVLYVGQAFPRRHLRETMLAFEQIAAEHPDLRLVAIGPDKYEPPIIAELVRTINARLGRPAVQHIAHVSEEELARFYAHASAFLYVSDTEAFGMPPLEAFSYGVPVVVADRPVHHEIFGPHAFYAQTNTVDDIASALRAALTDAQKHLAMRQAAPAILARYTWQAHTDRWLAMIEGLTT